jgi:hypothetical protein
MINNPCPVSIHRKRDFGATRYRSRSSRGISVVPRAVTVVIGSVEYVALASLIFFFAPHLLSLCDYTPRRNIGQLNRDKKSRSNHERL